MGCPSAGHPTDIFMDYSVLINNKSGKCSRVGIIGATKGFGYTLLAQIPTVKHMSLRCICARHPEECLEVLQETGFDVSRIAVCTTEDEIRAAGEVAIIITPDYRLVMETGITAMVECTGNTAVSSDAAILALKKGINRCQNCIKYIVPSYVGRGFHTYPYVFYFGTAYRRWRTYISHDEGRPL